MSGNPNRPRIAPNACGRCWRVFGCLSNRYFADPVAGSADAECDMIGGRTLHPKSYLPTIDRITKPSGAFCNGGPTLPLTQGTNDHVLSSYHTSPKIGKFGYRHTSGGKRGIAINGFDGHSTFITEAESREPDYWWPKGTVIPFSELNDASRRRVIGRLDSDYNYNVGR